MLSVNPAIKDTKVHDKLDYHELRWYRVQTSLDIGRFFIL